MLHVVFVRDVVLVLVLEYSSSTNSECLYLVGELVLENNMSTNCVYFEHEFCFTFIFGTICIHIFPSSPNPVFGTALILAITL